MGVANPNPLYPHHQAPFISRPLLSPVLQGRLPWCPAIILALGPPAPAPAPSPLPPRRGEPPLLCAYAHAPNAEHHPGNRPRGRSREWSRGRGVAVGPEHGAGHSFLWPPPAAALGPRSPVTSPSPSCDGPLPSPRLHRHRCLASRRGPLSLRPRPDAGALATRPPLPASGGKPGDGTPTPPVSICPVRKVFSFFDPGKIGSPPPGMAPQFITQQIRLANSAFRDDSVSSLGRPSLTPWPNPNHRFLVPMMAVSPLNRTLI